MTSLDDDHRENSHIYGEDTEFYDGLEVHPYHPYLELGLSRWLRAAPIAAEPAPEPPKPLLTTEEFTRKYRLIG